MKRLAAVALLASGLTLMVLPGGAGAGSTKPSTVDVFGSDSLGAGLVIAYGTVASPSAKCVANRKVKYQSSPPMMKRGEVNTLDTARTSTNGGWAVILDSDDLGAVQQAKLTPRKVGNTKCGGAVDGVT
jgi:hypothetical protein